MIEMLWNVVHLGFPNHYTLINYGYSNHLISTETLAVFAMFLAIVRLVPAAVLTLEMSEVSAILVFTTKTTQSRTQVFSVNGALTCRRLHL